jgi:hypothetical protein
MSALAVDTGALRIRSECLYPPLLPKCTCRSICQLGSIKQLYEVLYGVAPDDISGWQEINAFSHCVLEPLCWAGLLVEVEAEHQQIGESQYFKTPLWSAALKLDTDDMLEHAQRH